MKKPRFARLLAESQHKSPAEAAEMLDRIVHRILRRVRDGAPADWPGLGRFHPGHPLRFELPKEKAKRK